MILKEIFKKQIIILPETLDLKAKNKQYQKVKVNRFHQKQSSLRWLKSNQALDIAPHKPIQTTKPILMTKRNT